MLDIGCNAGFYSLQLHARGAQVTGIEHDPHYLAQARFAAASSAPTSSTCSSTSTTWTALGRQFDYVLFMGVLYHLRYPLFALDKVARLPRERLVFQSMLRGSQETAAGRRPTTRSRSGRSSRTRASRPCTSSSTATRTTRPTGGCRTPPAMEAMLRSCGPAHRPARRERGLLLLARGEVRERRRASRTAPPWWRRSTRTPRRPRAGSCGPSRRPRLGGVKQSVAQTLKGSSADISVSNQAPRRGHVALGPAQAGAHLADARGARTSAPPAPASARPGSGTTGRARAPGEKASSELLGRPVVAQQPEVEVPPVGAPLGRLVARGGLPLRGEVQERVPVDALPAEDLAAAPQAPRRHLLAGVGGDARLGDPDRAAELRAGAPRCARGHSSRGQRFQSYGKPWTASTSMALERAVLRRAGGGSGSRWATSPRARAEGPDGRRGWTADACLTISA